ncbi:hypothetical protein ABB02_00439 [Clostridiaceae bacterium JG1575]|nr:hypothetical protein ABB02_00439 [Clostridiaceae bacterium JG1575]
MNTIRFKLASAITVSALLALILTYIIINFNINQQYSIYTKANQAERDERIIREFRSDYIANNKKGWDVTSGSSVLREGQVSGFSVKLENREGKTVWQLEPELIISELNAKQPDGAAPITREQFKFQRHEIQVDGQVVGYVTLGQYTPLLISKNEEQFIFSLTMSVLVSAVIGSILIFPFSLFLSNQVSDPIVSIAKTSLKLSKGKLKTRETRQTDIVEIDQLRQSINKLGEKLDQQDTLRRRLVSDLSHELRNPLNVLQTNLEAMIDGVVPLTKERLASLNNEVIRFGKLIGNLNVLKEFEADSQMEQMKEVNLQTLCQDLYNNFLGVTQEKNQHLTFNYNRWEKYLIRGNYHSLYQVVLNLLHNAMKFTPEGGRINLYLNRDASYVTLRIRDSGMGIPKEDLGNIFERFYRVDKSREVIEGSGLGLTIVKRIMDNHDATIDVDSKVGIGTVFTLRFHAYQPIREEASAHRTPSYGPRRKEHPQKSP